jgi:hypothetical protein
MEDVLNSARNMADLLRQRIAEYSNLIENRETARQIRHRLDASIDAFWDGMERSRVLLWDALGESPNSGVQKFISADTEAKAAFDAYRYDLGVYREFMEANEKSELAMMHVERARLRNELSEIEKAISELEKEEN